MKCDLCESEATVHEVMIKGGQRHEKHLCEICARKQGMSVTTQPPVTQILSQFVAAQAKAADEVASELEATTPPVSPATPSVSSASVCPSCGLTYATFRNSGLLGCTACYTAFEGQLGPLLSRAHEGGTHHVGKSPRNIPPVLNQGLASRLGPMGLSDDLAVDEGASAAGAHDPDAAASEAEARSLRERLAVLQKQLADAIAGEQYEKAAKLRDQMLRLQTAGGSSISSKNLNAPEGARGGE